MNRLSALILLLVMGAQFGTLQAQTSVGTDQAEATQRTADAAAEAGIGEDEESLETGSEQVTSPSVSAPQPQPEPEQENEQEEDEGFVPSEEISEDEPVAFPVDI